LHAMIPALALSEADTRAKLIDPAIHAVDGPRISSAVKRLSAKSKSSAADHGAVRQDALTTRCASG
jgi:hypothetical protein